MSLYCAYQAFYQRKGLTCQRQSRKRPESMLCRSCPSKIVSGMLLRRMGARVVVQRWLGGRKINGTALFGLSACWFSHKTGFPARFLVKKVVKGIDRKCGRKNADDNVRSREGLDPPFFILSAKHFLSPQSLLLSVPENFLLMGRMYIRTVRQEVLNYFYGNKIAQWRVPCF